MSAVETLTRDEQQTVRIMQLLGDSTRYKMLKIMIRDQNMCVSDIASKLNVSVSAVSQHFKQFEMARLVERQRDGQRICYQLAGDEEIISRIQKVLGSEL